MILSIFALAAGLALLTVAADRSVLSAARLSAHFGMSPILIGALVIGLGTSIPELVVSLVAGEPAESMGNVIGSNISNLTLVLGTAALLRVLHVPRALVRSQGVLMAVAMAALALVLVDGEIARIEGLALLMGAVLVYTLLIRRSEAPPPDEPSKHEDVAVGIELIAAPLALVVTVSGAWLLVWSAERLADDIGLTSAFVGLVILAVGTSLPEFATAVAAARRDEPGLITGNVIGSNIFNSLVVGGSAGLAHPGSAGGLGGATILMVVIVALAALLSGRIGRLERWDGLILLGGFAALIAVSL